MSIDPVILNDIQNFNWNSIITVGGGIDDLNDAQLRFVKGLVVEFTTEKYSTLHYVGAVHRDFDWPLHNIGVELKSQFSAKMFNKDGTPKDKFDIKLSNSNGTNKKDKLNPEDVADIIIVVRRDGAFAIDKNTAIANSIQTGDGFSVSINVNDIDLITPTPVIVPSIKLNLKETIVNAIKNAIP